MGSIDIDGEHLEVSIMKKDAIIYVVVLATTLNDWFLLKIINISIYITDPKKPVEMDGEYYDG